MRRKTGKKKHKDQFSKQKCRMMKLKYIISKKYIKNKIIKTHDHDYKTKTSRIEGKLKTNNET